MNDLIFIDLGRHKRRLIEQLKDGRGRLMDEVEHALADVRAGLTPYESGKRYVPIVLIYRLPRKRAKGLLG